MTVPGIRRPGCTAKTSRVIGTASSARSGPTSPRGWCGDRRADSGSVKLSRTPVTVRCRADDVGPYGRCSKGIAWLYVNAADRASTVNDSRWAGGAGVRASQRGIAARAAQFQCAAAARPHCIANRRLLRRGAMALCRANGECGQRAGVLESQRCAARAAPPARSAGVLRPGACLESLVSRGALQQGTCLLRLGSAGRGAGRLRSGDLVGTRALRCACRARQGAVESEAAPRGARELRAGTRNRWAQRRFLVPARQHSVAAETPGGGACLV